MTPLFWLAISVAALLAVMLMAVLYYAEKYRGEAADVRAEIKKALLTQWRYIELKKYLIAHDFKIKTGKHFIKLDMVKAVNSFEASFPSHTTDKKPGE